MSPVVGPVRSSAETPKRLNTVVKDSKEGAHSVVTSFELSSRPTTIGKGFPFKGEPSSQPLSHDIHAATRKSHAAVNKLVTERLPLCLPPAASNARIYATGLRAFAEIFWTFEKEWKNIVFSPDSCQHHLTPRISYVLALPYDERLLRSSRLVEDLRYLLPDEGSLDPPPPDPSTSCVLTVAIEVSSRIRTNPHVLLAYLWVMYLALFNGGRWIRSQLRSAMPKWPDWPSQVIFWRECREIVPFLSFWEWSGIHDGEDIKAFFKVTFERAANQLTQRERLDVINEAVEIFAMCERIIRCDLDVWFDTALSVHEKSRQINIALQRHQRPSKTEETASPVEMYGYKRLSSTLGQILSSVVNAAKRKISPS